MKRILLLWLCVAALLSFPLLAQDDQPEQVLVKPLEGESKVRMRHEMDLEGMIMNENRDELPAGCREISEDVAITVHAGRKYAEQYPGTMFAYDQQEWNVKPCARITVTFVNEDDIRHQFMIHGLPEYLYPPTGMFHIELNGPGKKTAAFIVPSEPKTFLAHCEIAQHMEKGMKAQLKVAGGDGDIPNIPGLTGTGNPDDDAVPWQGLDWLMFVLAGLAGFGLAAGTGIRFRNRSNNRGIKTQKGRR